MFLKYHTEGLVLGNNPLLDSSKMFLILTPDFGLVRAVARSVRKPKAKLKSGLEDYSFGNFTFIKTKAGYKITDAIMQSNIYFSCSDKNKFKIIARFSSLLKKLLPEEEGNTDLFYQFMDDIRFLLKADLSDKHLRSMECLTVLRILSHLGYLEKESWGEFIDQKPEISILEMFSAFRAKSVREINRSLKESQLI